MVPLAGGTLRLRSTTVTQEFTIFNMFKSSAAVQPLWQWILRCPLSLHCRSLAQTSVPAERNTPPNWH
jgi:hypothetical protein